jgi:ankyrin repeat protein
MRRTTSDYTQLSLYESKLCLRLLNLLLFFSGLTPLHGTAGNNLLDICRLLLEKGANINAKDNGLFPPNYFLFETKVCLRLFILLRFFSGKTPLYYSAHHNRLESCRLLLEEGADIHAQDNE